MADCDPPSGSASTARRLARPFGVQRAGRNGSTLARADEKYRWFLFRAHPLAEASGQAVKWCGLGTDIDDRKQAEAALRESERNSRLFVDGIPGLVAGFTPGGEVEFVNRQVLDYFGGTLEELKRWETGGTTHPEDLPRVVELFSQSIASGDPFEFEVRARRSDGVYRWFQSRGLPLRDTNGRILRWYNLLIDIDERKRAEEALRRSETQLAAAERDLQLMIDTIPVFVQRISPTERAVSSMGHGRITWASRSRRRRAQVQGPFLIFIPPMPK